MPGGVSSINPLTSLSMEGDALPDRPASFAASTRIGLTFLAGAPAISSLQEAH
jgi:hypothetical protein